MNMREIRRLGTWQEWLGDAVHLLILCLIGVIALALAAAFQPPDQPRQAAEKVCGAEGGNCQW